MDRGLNFSSIFISDDLLSLRLVGIKTGGQKYKEKTSLKKLKTEIIKPFIKPLLNKVFIYLYINIYI